METKTAKNTAQFRSTLDAMRVDVPTRVHHKIYPSTYRHEGIAEEIIGLARSIDKKARKNEWALSVTPVSPIQEGNKNSATPPPEQVVQHIVRLSDQLHGASVPKEFIRVYQNCVQNAANSKQMEITWIGDLAFSWEAPIQKAHSADRSAEVGRGIDPIT